MEDVDDDAMSTSPAQVSSSSSNNRRQFRRTLHHGTPYGESMTDEDESSFAHVPDYEIDNGDDLKATLATDLSSTGNINSIGNYNGIHDNMMAFASVIATGDVETISMTETNYISQEVLEISPPPSPDTLNQDTDEDAMDLTLQAEFVRRSTLVRKSSACGLEETLTTTTTATSGQDVLFAPIQSPTKRPRLVYDSPNPATVTPSFMFDAVH